MDVHLSNKACQKVWEFSKSLQPVLVVEKVPWLQVRPKKWRSSGPTHDCIGLFFFPPSFRYVCFCHCFLFFYLFDSEVLIVLMHFRPNEVSNKLTREIIESDSALKLTVGVADLLIFPSTILPEQNHCKLFGWRIPSPLSYFFLCNTGKHLVDTQAIFCCSLI